MPSVRDEAVHIHERRSPDHGDQTQETVLRRAPSEPRRLGLDVRSGRTFRSHPVV